VDGIGAGAGSSAAVILEHMLEGWQGLGGDELHVVLDPTSRVAVPAGVDVEHVDTTRQTELRRIRAQTFVVPRVCRAVGADAMVGLLPSATVAPLPCPRLVIAYDMRHELLPEQFSFKQRWLKKISYGIGWRQADAIACITERTKRDLLAPRPWLRDHRIGIAPLGSDHVGTWPTVPIDEPYAVAFGQYGNKNVDMVIDAWGVLRDRGEAMPIKLIGMPDAARATAEAHIGRLGLGELVEPVGWLFGEDLQRCFASAGLFVFPSDFEGFGIPAVEAMRLRIPLVISPEDALLEVTDGHATVMEGWGPEPLADAVVRARCTAPERLDAARARAEEFTWRRMAESIRSLADQAIAARRTP